MHVTNVWYDAFQIKFVNSWSYLFHMTPDNIYIYIYIYVTDRSSSSQLVFIWIKFEYRNFSIKIDVTLCNIYNLIRLANHTTLMDAEKICYRSITFLYYVSTIACWNTLFLRNYFCVPLKSIHRIYLILILNFL